MTVSEQIKLGKPCSSTATAAAAASSSASKTSPDLHYIEPIPVKGGKRKKSYQRCRQCSKNKIRKETAYRCKTCPGNPHCVLDSALKLFIAQNKLLNKIGKTEDTSTSN